VRCGGVCRVHGGAAPRVRAKRLERIALAEALAADPARPPAQVLEDVLHSADYLMRQARSELAADKPSAATMAKLIELSETAGRWAKITLDLGVAERTTAVLESQAIMLFRVISAALTAVIVDDSARQRVLALVSEGLRAQNVIEADPVIEAAP
jgi:hypothetical protein